MAGRLRGHRWTPVQRAIVVAILATAVGSLYLITFALALADPVPHRIEAALVGDAAAHPGPVEAVERVASGKLAFSRYPSTAAALRAIDQQGVYAALGLTSSKPALYVASAAGVSVARVLDRIAAVDPGVRLVDTHPLSEHDPNGVESSTWC
jgi:hypothetical protein